MRDSTYVRVLARALLFLAAATSTSAQYAWFSRNTDVIAVSGQTDLTSACTIEAVIMLPSTDHSGGSVFDEWALTKEEKYLGVSIQSIDATAFPNPYIQVDEPGGLITLDKWHHIAFVADGSEERIYLDGQQLQSGPASATILNSDAPAYIGYAPRAGSDFSSFAGYLDSIRVSRVARYTALSFTPLLGDLPSDADTVLLYNFNDPTNATTVVDESPLGRTGTLGQGFPGATSPKIISKFPTAVSLGLQIYTAVELRFNSSMDSKYQLQSSPDMVVWSDLPDIIAGDGTTITKFISTVGTQRLFYRVVSRP